MIEKGGKDRPCSKTLWRFALADRRFYASRQKPAVRSCYDSKLGMYQTQPLSEILCQTQKTAGSTENLRCRPFRFLTS
jgi:hypothetical protein